MYSATSSGLERSWAEKAEHFDGCFPHRQEKRQTALILFARDVWLQCMFLDVLIKLPLVSLKPPKMQNTASSVSTLSRGRIPSIFISHFFIKAVPSP